MESLEDLKQQLRKFASDRDWDQFHSPKNIAMALSVEVSELLATYFLALAEDLGLQTTLQQMNIEQADLPMLAEQAMLQQRLLINNPRDVSLDDALAIYQQAF